jgi:putative serine protease PepD
VIVAAIAVIALTVPAGLVGGLIAHRLDNDKTLAAPRPAALPAVDRSSLADVVNKVEPSVVSIDTGNAEGSGVIISADGAILTNNHVVATVAGNSAPDNSGTDASATGNTVTVTFSTGKTAKATIVGTDPASDLAVIKAQGMSGLAAATFGNSDALQQGDTVLAIGSPLGLEGSVTAGIVSALHRTFRVGSESGQPTSISDAIQTDAAINPGNSGGPLIDLSGEVVGINSAIATAGQGNGNIGVGFAIPSNHAKQVATELLKGQKISHPFLGVQVGDAASGGGAVISGVVSGGPAAAAGLRQGDVITKAGDRDVHNSEDLVTAVQAGKPGDKLQLTVIRNGSQLQVTVTLGEAS